MSTKIYYAYEWAENPQLLIKFLGKLRCAYIVECTNYLTKIITLQSLETIEKECICLDYFLHDEIKSGQWSPFNIDASIVVYFHKNKIILQLFGFELFGNIIKIFNKRMKYYGYWDNTDRDENCSEEDWNNREDFFDSLYKKSSYPSDVGLMYTLSTKSTLSRICRIVKRRIKG